MKLPRIAVLFVACSVALSAAAKSKLLQESGSKPAAQHDDVPKSIADSVSGTLQFAEGNFLAVVEAMPENKYAFVPTGGNFDGARSFGEQVKHVACAQFAFFNEFEGKKPPDDCEKGGHDPAKTKAELIKYLKDSFDYSNRVLATLNAKNALERVEGRYAGPSTKLGISVVAVWHITDHYGQLVEYVRMNGIVPQ
jgi:DinB family protein